MLGAQGVIRAAEPFLSALVTRPVTNTELSEVEQDAACLNYFDSMTIPTLLHTQAYARAVIGAFPPTLDGERLDLLVSAHLERGAALEHTPPVRVSFVVDESALRRPIGGREVLGEQLAHVARIARRGNVTFQVLPLDCLLHQRYGIIRSQALTTRDSLDLVEKLAAAYG